MDLNGALDIADRVSDRNLSWAEHPSLINMIYAVEVLADAFRDMERKREEWQTRAENMRDEAEAWKEQAQGADDLNAELDRTQGAWSDLMEFIRSALNLDVRALDDPAEVRKILGRAFADARLWSRVKDMVGGKFVAGDVVTADAMNAFSQAVMTADGRVKLNFDIMAAFSGPDRQHFPIGSPEPAARVQKVKRPQGDITFIRFGRLSDGRSLWRRVGDDSKTYLTWAQVVQFQAAVEVPGALGGME